MSTRCNILIRYDRSHLWLYRHWDGYMAETGADLATRAIACNGSPAEFLRSIIAAKYEGENRPMYCATSTRQGDIEWLYAVDLSLIHI